MRNCLMLAIAGCLLSISAYAQSPIINIEGSADAITARLHTALTLTEPQQEKVRENVLAFLKQKANIMPLRTTNEKMYSTKLGSLQNGLFSRLKKTLTPEQFETFEKLKPPAPDGVNVLSLLFY